VWGGRPRGNPGGGGEGCPRGLPPTREMSRPKAVHEGRVAGGVLGGGTSGTGHHPAGCRLVFRVWPGAGRRCTSWCPPPLRMSVQGLASVTDGVVLA
jgi:hypothetical protein